jgi:hypothetical protein
MKILKNKNGVVTAELTLNDLQAIGAAVWAAKEEDLETLYDRFFPEEEEDQPTREEFSDAMWDLLKPLREAGVFMG